MSIYFAFRYNIKTMKKMRKLVKHYKTPEITVLNQKYS